MVNVSIVLYQHKSNEIAELISALQSSCVVNKIILIDNSPYFNSTFLSMEGVEYLFSGKNLGYGRGHNIALRTTIAENIEYHLVLNPDVELNSDILLIIERYMDEHRSVGLLSPKMFSSQGKLQYQCKLLPTPLDLLIRRFLPKSMMIKRRARFEMRASGYDHIMEVPYIQGSFMFIRTKALEEIGLFDERFFLYPEDIDMSRRIFRKFNTIYFPEVSIVHHHEQASYKNLRMLLIHIINIIRYFNKWGWFNDKERKIINEAVLRSMKSNFTVAS
jgi:GT2 family glycosyltransferase